MKIKKEITRDLLINMAHNSLLTKVPPATAAMLDQIVVDAVLAVQQKEGEPIDLHMVEIMHIKHKLATDTIRV